MRIENPANQSLLAEVQEDSASLLSAKVARARKAQPDWASAPLDARLGAIGRFRDAVVRELDALARVLTQEMGKPIAQAKNELRSLSARIDFFLGHAAAVLADERVHQEPGLDEVISHEPLGVVANVSAWNYPWFVGSNVFVPALLTGNTVLYKPSEYATLTGQAIARLLHESGISEDVFIPVIGGGDVGKMLVDEPVDAVFFTGSYRTGRRIAELVGPRLIKLGLELGGKDPTYVSDDADVKMAAESLADGAMYNAGQSCCSVERIYVHRAMYERFLDAFVETVRGFRIGDPEDPETYVGPLARRAQLDVLSEQVADAVEKGARLLLGGSRLERPGNYFAPTVLADATEEMQVMREESFGPIIGVAPVDSDDEAVRRMNDTQYGLTAGMYTQSRERARDVLSRVNAGSVYWNCCDRVSPRLPWTGRGHSGLGSTLSTYGIRTFLQPKAWHLRSV